MAFKIAAEPQVPDPFRLNFPTVGHGDLGIDW
jgi:hypothetical protein